MRKNQSPNSCANTSLRLFPTKDRADLDDVDDQPNQPAEIESQLLRFDMRKDVEIGIKEGIQIVQHTQSDPGEKKCNSSQITIVMHKIDKNPILILS